MPKVATIALVTSSILAGCSGDGRASEVSGGRQTAPEAHPGPRVGVEALAFRPRTLEVAHGTTVTWANAETMVHTVTSGAQRTTDGMFHAELTTQGATFRFTFKEVGTFPYFCAVHTGMEGEITVN